ncbi:LysR substrate-binding domain-containing protein [Marinomonas ostreistagni]|uniref:LysR family transcriptional regulator n=1 Tax=Marinomonas ostreistagni TaxID=359209 RepID=A0ABS0ZG01_9GAMM|nr:LysR substrate-binding domain-containing protein [Marinomonas ostreistagni]MBJ7552562.1 LysR family transcriptional regulator [Marinomonas ostreistagni]
MIPYSALRAFQKVVQLGSLKAAAESLHITESAISHQLKKLEQHTNTQLLYKEGRGLKVTEKGKVLADRISEPFSDIDYAYDEIKQLSESCLNIYCIPSLINDWLMPRLVAFNQGVPDMSVSLKYLQSMPAHIDEHSICIKSIEVNSTQHYPFEVLMNGETIPVCSPLYLAQRGPINTHQCLAQQILLHDQNTDSWNDWLIRLGIEHAQQPHQIYEDFYLLKFAAMAAQGVALCPMNLIQNELADGTLVQLFHEQGNIGRKYVIEHNHRPSPATQLLLQFLLKDERVTGIDSVK